MKWQKKGTKNVNIGVNRQKSAMMVFGNVQSLDPENMPRIYGYGQDRPKFIVGDAYFALEPEQRLYLGSSEETNFIKKIVTYSKNVTVNVAAGESVCIDIDMPGVSEERAVFACSWRGNKNIVVTANYP